MKNVNFKNLLGPGPGVPPRRPQTDQGPYQPSGGGYGADGLKTTMTTTTQKSGNGKKAVIFGAVGAAAGFGVCRILKSKHKVTIITVLVLAATGAFIGYRQV